MLQVADAMDPAEPAELIAAAADGNLSAFEHLYRQFSPRVYGLCLRLTGQREAAEDCTQESFVAAWRALARFENRSRFSTWLRRIAVHTVLARRRGLRVQYEVAEPDSGLPEVADPSGDVPPTRAGRPIRGARSRSSIWRVKWRSKAGTAARSKSAARPTTVSSGSM
jgi:RNA polymerase sigma factor (sigma-70 family)